MIEFQNVRKTYRLGGVEKVILKDLTMTFPSDTNIGILGHNGAGKSTLMRLIAGAELPDEGRIKRNSNISWPLGFGGGFNGQMTGIENIRFVARMYGHDIAEMTKFVEDFAEIGESIGLPIASYSSGMKARLAFGISMAIDFDYYLIDEITAVGDAKFKRKCKEIFEQKLQNSNIIIISHSNQTIRDYCTSACLLDDGVLTYYEDLEGAIKQHNLNQAK